jgi:gliding motility-associated-like protein
MKFYNFIAFTGLLAFAAFFTAGAQMCNGNLGAPVLNETFGAGNDYGIGPALSNGTTNMHYYADACAGPDADMPSGEYTINTELPGTCKGGTWVTISHDHTGDKYGYMMVINASDAPSLFYTKRVSGSILCPGTTYFFGAWVTNILKDEPQTRGYIKPNLTFNIKKVDGTLLASVNTGDINAVTEVTWMQYGALFTSPVDGSDVIVEIKNNAPGGFGNDLALDDITFSPCGPLIQTGFATVTDTASRKICAHSNYNYLLVSSQSGYVDPGYQWQQNKNDGAGWVNIPGATSPTLQVSAADAPAATLQYRVGLLNKTQAGSESCRIYSSPLTINIYGQSSYILPPTFTACLNHPFVLGATDGDTFEWTGPNNFSATVSSPLVTENATAAVAGVYSLKIVKNNCPSFQYTTVSVVQSPTVSAINNVTICRGSSAQLHSQSTNATHFVWMPATGLDNSNAANPMATPDSTTTYTLTVSNDGCTDIQPTAKVTVTVLQLPLASAGNPIVLFEGNSAILQGKVSGDDVNFYWTPSTFLNNPLLIKPVTTPTDNITYTLHVISNENCGESTSSVLVRVYKKLGIPNTFTPNNDGINDEWDITNINTYPNAEMSIFNRYGQLLFHSIGYPKPWNGTYNGLPLPVDTYYYVIKLKEDNLPIVSGWVLIKK